MRVRAGLILGLLLLTSNAPASDTQSTRWSEISASKLELHNVTLEGKTSTSTTKLTYYECSGGLADGAEAVKKKAAAFAQKSTKEARDARYLVVRYHTWAALWYCIDAVGYE